MLCPRFLLWLVVSYTSSTHHGDISNNLGPYSSQRPKDLNELKKSNTSHWSSESGLGFLLMVWDSLIWSGISFQSHIGILQNVTDQVRRPD